MTGAAELLNTYQKAEGLLIAGELRQAADLCKQILDANPNFPYGYHLMSALFRATGTFEKALTFSQMAIRLEPRIAAFHIQQGQVFFALSHWDDAAKAFEQASQLEPTNQLALLLWADTCAQQGKFEEANRLFRKLRNVGDMPEIDEHEGLCLSMQGNVKEAEKRYDRVIQRRPDYAWGYIHKGKLLLEQMNDSEAEGCFARAIKLDPQAYEALQGLAVVSDRQGQLEMAINYATRAVNIQTNTSLYKALVFLGSLLLRKGAAAAAEQVFAQALMLQPDSIYALHGMTNALVMQQKTPQALPYVEKAMAVKPDHPVLRHFYAMVKGETIESAPKEYIIELFDSSAERFDYHLQQRLAYKIPTLIADMLRALPQLEGRTNMSLLDLGCGTGLVGEALRDVTKTRIGVDLSQKMLDKARGKQLYTELYTLDIVEYMIASTRVFDLVVAADVLIYVGNLSSFIKAARNAMSVGSVLAFTIEREDVAKQFKLNMSGRYSHNPLYVQALAEEEGYELVHKEDCIVRTEGAMPVKGCTFILKKAQTH